MDSSTTDGVAVDSTAGNDLVDGGGFRPVERMTLAKQQAVRNLARVLVENHGFTEGGADALAQTVADPAAVRRQLAAPDEIKVFGGTLLTVSARVSTLGVVPHVTNGRVIGSTPYPASDTVDGESAGKYWPERDLSAQGGELTLAGGSRQRVNQALELADVELLAHNAWEESIRTNGVFAPVTLVVLRIVTADGDTVWVLSAVDGSSRVASCHRILGIEPGDPVFGTVASPRIARGRLQELMGALNRSRDEVTETEIEQARAATVPATIVIGFRPEGHVRSDLVDALDEYVALLHLEPPTPWAAPARDNKIADSVIDALREIGTINGPRSEWLAGMMAPADAIANGFSPEPDARAAEVIKMITAPSDSQEGYAIGLGIRRRTLRQRVRRGPKAEVAASLALRSYSTANVNRRKVATALLQNVFELDEFWADWSPTGRNPDEILEEALTDLDRGASVSAATELAALASYHLTVHGALGTQEPGAGEITDPATGLTRQRDKREPKAVIASMLRSAHGLHGLHRAIVDGRQGEPPKQVNEDGSVALTVNGQPVGPMTNFWLRTSFRDRPAEVKQDDLPESPRRLLHAAVRRLKVAVGDVVDALTAVEAVMASDGVTPLVRVEGVEEATVNDLRARLDGVMDTLSAHKGTWRQRHPRPDGDEPTDDESAAEADL